jgi:hypothetical protein
MELSMGMFMGLMFIVGLVLTIYAFKIAPKVKNCSSKSQNAARGLLVMGVMMLCVSATYMVCGCGRSLGKGTLGTSFVVFMLIVGIITIALSSIIHKECGAAKSDTPALITLSVLMTVLSGGYLVFKGYTASKAPKLGF